MGRLGRGGGGADPRADRGRSTTRTSAACSTAIWKPGNILLDADGIPWLTDFGRLQGVDGDHRSTGSAAQLGTPHYMPPEPPHGSGSSSAAAVSTAGDVWALGVILWEMLLRRAAAQRRARPVEILEEDRGRSADRRAPARVGGPGFAHRRRAASKKIPRGGSRPRRELADEIARWSWAASRCAPARLRRAAPRQRVRRKPVWAALIAEAYTAGLSNAFLLTRANDAVETLTHTNDQPCQSPHDFTATKLALDARFQVAEDPARALLLAVEAAESTERLHAGVLPEAADALTEVLQKVSGRDISPEGPAHGGGGEPHQPVPGAGIRRSSARTRKWVITLDHCRSRGTRSSPRSSRCILQGEVPIPARRPGSGRCGRTRPLECRRLMPDSRHLLRVCACGCVTVTDPLRQAAAAANRR
ncbi:MAG: protein kinase [Verrucomicrobiales bacterium]